MVRRCIRQLRVSPSNRTGPRIPQMQHNRLVYAGSIQPVYSNDFILHIQIARELCPCTIRDHPILAEEQIASPVSYSSRPVDVIKTKEVILRCD